VALDGAFMLGPTNTSVDDLGPEHVLIPARQQPGCRRTQRRLQRYRTGAEGRISHLKRRYGLDRSRLTGAVGQQIWPRWSILAYDLDTLAVRAG
jgi:transposase, IS5 family